MLLFGNVHFRDSMQLHRQLYHVRILFLMYLLILL